MLPTHQSELYLNPLEHGAIKAPRDFTKRSEYTVEECEQLCSRDIDRKDYPTGSEPVLCRDLDGFYFKMTYARRGFVKRYATLLCARCERLQETLYITPRTMEDYWLCRHCLQLIYACQRYGNNHPLRKVGTPRTRITAARKLEAEKKKSIKNIETKRAQKTAEQAKQQDLAIQAKFNAPHMPEGSICYYGSYRMLTNLKNIPENVRFIQTYGNILQKFLKRPQHYLPYVELVEKIIYTFWSVPTKGKMPDISGVLNQKRSTVQNWLNFNYLPPEWTKPR